MCIPSEVLLTAEPPANLPKVSTTTKLRIVGSLTPEHMSLYGATVTWHWVLKRPRTSASHHA